MDPTDECVRLVKLNRWITNKQHLNWFCSKDTCDYSRVSQAVGGLEIDDIIDAQEEGYQKPPVPEVRANQIAMMPLEDESESGEYFLRSVPFQSRSINSRAGVLTGLPDLAVAAVNGSSGTATANGPAAAIAEMDQSQTDNTSPTPTVGTTQEKAKKPKPWVDLATLDPHTQRKIRELRHEIRRHGPKRRGGLTWWAKCETQLLGICANLKFPHDQILSVGFLFPFFPRLSLSRHDEIPGSICGGSGLTRFLWICSTSRDMASLNSGCGWLTCAAFPRVNY